MDSASSITYYQNQIHDAILDGDISLIDSTLAEEDQLNLDDPLPSGGPPLILACKHLQYRVVEHLLQVCRVNVDIKDEEGNTSLLVVCNITDDVQYAKLLIDMGADSFVKN